MTTVRQIKWTKRGQNRFREQQDYITADNCREVAILSVCHTAFLIESMHSL